MLIQQMHTGPGILQAVQLSSVMFEYKVDITWYNIHTLRYMNHAAT